MRPYVKLLCPFVLFGTNIYKLFDVVQRHISAAFLKGGRKNHGLNFCLHANSAAWRKKNGNRSPLEAFLQRDAMLARVLAIWACVRLSVTSRCSIETDERIELGFFGM